jgi:hypothetical protein
MEGIPVVYPLLGLALGAAVVVALWLRSRRGGRGGGGVAGPGGGGGGAEQRLRAAAGDAVAERLIRFEQGRAPDLTRSAAAERAYDRLMADRTR